MERHIGRNDREITTDRLRQESKGSPGLSITMECKQDLFPLTPLVVMKPRRPKVYKMPGHLIKIIRANPKKSVFLVSCLTNCMPNNQFKRGELYSFITGKASTAIARNLQKKFNAAGLKITIEQWSVLYHLWKEDGKSQQELCSATFRDKPSITRLVDNLEKQQLVKRVPSEQDRRINLIFLTRQAQKLQEETMQLAEATLNEALEGVPTDRIDVCKEVLQIVYDNLR